MILPEETSVTLARGRSRILMVQWLLLSFARSVFRIFFRYSSKFSKASLTILLVYLLSSTRDGIIQHGLLNSTEIVNHLAFYVCIPIAFCGIEKRKCKLLLPLVSLLLSYAAAMAIASLFYVILTVYPEGLGRIVYSEVEMSSLVDDPDARFSLHWHNILNAVWFGFHCLLSLAVVSPLYLHYKITKPIVMGSNRPTLNLFNENPARRVDMSELYYEV